jgi:hemolysin III
VIAIDESGTLAKWTQSLSEEIANSVSHGIGFVAALISTPILLSAAGRHGSSGFLLGTVVFSVTTSILYLGSTLYHAWPPTRAKHFLQSFDHSAIYVLIAGTYTPFALGPLHGHGGLVVLGLIWFAAIFGVILKMTRGTWRHRKLAMSLYLGMGWLIPLTYHPLMLAIPFSALIWLLAGGIAYTGGVLFFINKRLRYSHLVWHFFVLIGTSCHFMAVLSCAN